MLKFHPKKGQIFMCDFSGFKIPEMIKKRPVIIITPPMKGKDHRLVSVVPLSTKTPQPISSWHYGLHEKHLPRSGWFQNNRNWVKADMIYTISTCRLEPIKLGRDKDGVYKYFNKKLPKEVLDDIEKCILTGLGMR